MKRILTLAFALATMVALPLIATAKTEDRLYDFTDAYYLQNGINPAAIDGRRQPGPLAVTDKPNFPFQRNVRSLLTLPNYDNSANQFFFTVLGGFSANAFTGNAAGQRARQIADTSVEYVFPRRGTDPVGLGALRQSVILDMRNGYFSNNPLGLWIHVWVSFTSAALNTAACAITSRREEPPSPASVAGPINTTMPIKPIEKPTTRSEVSRSPTTK